MSKSLNKVILIGNLGSDPEIRSLGSGARVAEFSLATNKRWNDRNGQQQENTEWHRIVAWDNERGLKLADIAERFMKKGDRVYVEGEIQYRSYQDKDGNTRYVTEIKANDVILLSGRDSSAGDSGSGFQSRAKQPATAGKAKGKEEDYEGFSAEFPEDDDLPF